MFRPGETEEARKLPEKVVWIRKTEKKKVRHTGIQPSGDMTLGS